MRTAPDVPDPLFRELKTESALGGVTLSDLVTELVQSGLARRKTPATSRPARPSARDTLGNRNRSPVAFNREIEDLLTSGGCAWRRLTFPT